MNFTQVVTVFIFTVLVLTYIQAQCMDDAAQREEARYIQYCDCSRQSLSNTGISNESLQFSLAKLDTLEALQKYDTEIGQNVKSEVQNVKVDIGNVKSEVENVKSEVQNVKNEVQYVKSDVGTVRSEVNNLTRQVHLVTQTNFQQTETLERLTNRTERRFSDVDTSLSSTLAILQGMNSTLVHLAQRIHLLETRTVCMLKNMIFFNGSCYYFVSDLEKNWQDAREHCKKTFVADLVAIESEAENNFLKNELDADSGKAFYGFWTSLKETNHIWRWESSGSVLQGYTDWLPNEPNSANENCAHMYNKQDAQNRWQWNDLLCSRDLHFICELKL